MLTLSRLILALLVNALSCAVAKELGHRAAFTELPAALETANYASIFNTSCPTSITPRYTTYISKSTITSFAVVGCGDEKGTCKSGYVTTSSVCCPSGWIPTSFGQVYCYTSASGILKVKPRVVDMDNYLHPRATASPKATPAKATPATTKKTTSTKSTRTAVVTDKVFMRAAKSTAGALRPTWILAPVVVGLLAGILL